MIAYGRDLFGDVQIVPARERRFRALAVVGIALVAAYAIATALGAPASLLAFVFNLPMLAIAPLAWWAFHAAPPASRRLWFLLATAASLWLGGTVGWTVEFVRNGERIPTPPTAWDGAFFLAMILTLAALLMAMRDAIRLSDAALDTIVVIAPGLAIGVAFIDRQVEHAVSTASLLSLYRPVLAVATLILIVSAGVGASDGMRRSVGLIGIGQVFLTIGHLIYSYETLRGGTLDDRWTDVAWAAGAVASILAASAVILRADPPIRFGRPRDAAGYPPGSRAAILLGFAGLATSIIVAWLGMVTGRTATTVVGGVSIAAVIVSLALRQWKVWSAGSAAYDRLDAALAREEEARDRAVQANAELRASIAELSNANLQLRLYHAALRGLLHHADRETRGELRAMIASATGSRFEELDDAIAGDEPT